MTSFDVTEIQSEAESVISFYQSAILLTGKGLLRVYLVSLQARFFVDSFPHEALTKNLTLILGNYSFVEVGPLSRLSKVKSRWSTRGTAGEIIFEIKK